MSPIKSSPYFVGAHRWQVMLLEQIVEQLVRGGVELVVGFVRAGFDLGADVSDLVGADVVGLERLEQVTHATQLDLVGGVARLGRLGADFLLDGVGGDFLNRRISAYGVDRAHGHIPVKIDARGATSWKATPSPLQPACLKLTMLLSTSDQAILERLKRPSISR